jgi:hypothetical protein
MNLSTFRHGVGAKEASNFWPRMNADETVLDDLTGPIIGSALTVSNVLGAGLLEKVYQNALAYELRESLSLRRRGTALRLRNSAASP